MTTLSQQSQPQLQKNALGLFSIVAAVIATNGPLTALVGAVPATLAIGNGIGLPSVYLIVGFVYLIFSVGFVAMSRYTKNAGAFYSYIAKGLGRPWAVSAAFLAIIAYNAMQLAIYAMLGYFLSDALKSWLGIDVSWWVCCFVALGVILIASISNIKISGKLLLFLLLLELSIIVIFDVAAFAHGGPTGYTLQPFTPGATFTAGFGVAIVFVVGSYMGFETTAIYAEEAKDPKRNIPLATYIAITTIMVIYAVSVWALIIVWGANDVVAQATQSPAELWYGMAERLSGKLVSQAMSVLMLTSLFAALLSFHNTTSRYIFSLARESVFPTFLAAVHPRQMTPYAACTAQAIGVVLVMSIFVYFDADPMGVVLPYTAAHSTIGLLTVQAMTSLAVICFFWRDHRGLSAWTRLYAPAISGLCLAGFVVMEVAHLELLTGSTSNWIVMFPLSIAMVGVGGIVYAYWLKSRQPEKYQGLGHFLAET
ncbi:MULTISPECIES: APC family permease [unclassified Pseudomonas]|uniref:APC family permease n=1 Tax=unclassified Pseudomonas TaxID=196821 RepID=UPI00161393A1|nr:MULTISPECIES: APC family permease [unclassified Pseudomonas]MBB6290509.1 amino acid transporter [Pseudomonas sp. SJZ073]MBB6315764.1 amino acid transporter [Pseudomonas sp. JAI120]